MGVGLFCRACSETRKNGLKIREQTFRIDITNTFSLLEWSGIGTAAQGDGEDTSSKSVWIWHWEMWFSALRVTGAVLGGRLNRIILRVSSNRGDSVNKGGEAPVSPFRG